MVDDRTMTRGLDALAIKFPQSGYIGVAAEFAELLSQSYESPKEFLYLDCLAFVGATVSGRVRADFDLPVQTRMYVLKVAKSAWRRKSTSTRLAEKFVNTALAGVTNLELRDRARTVWGLGSAEGLGQALKPLKLSKEGEDPERYQLTRRVVVCFDEFRRLEAKAGIKNSVLLPMLNELYESNQYDNATVSNPFEIADGHVSFLSNTTEESFKDMLNAAEFRDLGFFNRMFTVVSDSRKRVARPKAPPENRIAPIRSKLTSYFAELPPLLEDGGALEEIIIPLTPEADRRWEQWYNSLPETEETARLDNLGMRLMGLLAFTSGLKIIDEELLQSVLDILEYQRQVRLLYRPIEADNPLAKMEQKIIRVIREHGPASRGEIYNRTHAERVGRDIFGQALRNLSQDTMGAAHMLEFNAGDNKFHLVTVSHG